MHRCLSFARCRARRIFRSISTYDAKKSTIFSLCSGAGKSGVAVIRVSGPSSLHVLTSMTEWKSQNIDCQQMQLKKIFHPSTREQIDRGIVLWFPGPNSFTGEDVCELHVHGGPAIIKQVYNALSSLPNTRHALPGEFIRRSFENGKVDLTQIEGLSDLLNAENEMQRKQALKMSEGYSKNIYKEWTTKLTKGMAHIEAFIDFGDEGHMGEEILLEVKNNMSVLLGDMEHHLRDGGVYEKIRDGLKICIVGEPNVGKSSLLNSLCKRPVSIVTSHAGTTRDIIEVPLNVEGHRILLSDTAGLRKNTADEVEKIGIERAYDQTENSDVLILVVDSTSDEVEDLCRQPLSPSVVESFILKKLENLGLSQGQRQILLVFNKIDAAQECVSSAINESFRLVHEKNNCIKTTMLGEEVTDHSVLFGVSCQQPKIAKSSCQNEVPLKITTSPLFTWCVTSCISENGLKDLSSCLKHLVDESFVAEEHEENHPMNARHRLHLEKVVAHLTEFLHINSQPAPLSGYDTRLEMAAEQLRGALHQMGLITGHVTSDDILSQVFKDFCIGK